MVEGYLAEKWGLGESAQYSPIQIIPYNSVSKSITSAATASATVGTAFTYTITTDVTNPAFRYGPPRVLAVIWEPG